MDLRPDGQRMGQAMSAGIVTGAEKGFIKTEPGKKVFIKTFGCQMNEYDSDKMADVLHAAQGYDQPRMWTRPT